MLLFDLANLTYWIFLGIGIALFLLVIISGGDEQDLDTDADMNVDVDADSEVELNVPVNDDIDADTDSDFSFWSILSWFGVGNSPLLILLAIDFSTWGVTGWFLNALVGTFLNGIPRGFLGLLIFVVSFIFSLWAGKVLSHPIGLIFKEFGEEINSDRLIGCVGTVTSKQVPHITTGRIAQADVLDNASNLVTVEICLPEWAKVIPLKGDDVLIIEQRKNCFLAIAKDSSDEDKWLNKMEN
jgi:hypothetical protein